LGRFPTVFHGQIEQLVKQLPRPFILVGIHPTLTGIQHGDLFRRRYKIQARLLGQGGQRIHIDPVNPTGSQVNGKVRAAVC
jgi:hypothetical protein